VKASICIETQQGASYEGLLAAAREAEQIGFDGFYCSDHYLQMSWKAGPSGGWPGPTDAWTTLAGLARDTTTIRLGTLLSSATFRQPVPLAIIVAQVDAMSGGRAVLGLGAGWFSEEHEVQGIPLPPVAERFDRLEEQLAIVTGLWHTPPGELFDFSGQHYVVRGSPALPKPVQQPGPPIIIGGNGRRRTPALAARYGSEFNAPFVSAEAAGRLFVGARSACEAAGRDPESLQLSAGVIVCCGANTQELARRAAAMGIDPAKPEEGVVCGTPTEVIGRLAEWTAAGASHLYAEVPDLGDLEYLHLLAEVMTAS